MSEGFFWFLATPYSDYPHGHEAAFALAVEQRGLLVKAGIPVFSPIVHSHPVAMRCGLDPRDLSIWLPSEAALLACAGGLIMVKAVGWEASKGMWYEWENCSRRGLPVVWMEPGVVPDLTGES